MAGKRSVLFEILGDIRGMRASIKEAEDLATRLNHTVDRIGTRMKQALGAAGVAGAVHLGAQLFTLGGQAEAFQRRYQTVFAGATDVLDRFIEAQSSRFGISDAAMQGLASSVGDLLVPLGMERDAAADITVESLETANALSEWTGGQRTAEDVTQILIGAMLGERDALKGLGVDLDQADIDARLAQKGQEALTGEARKQAEALATLELVREQSADALTAYTEGEAGAQAAAKEFSAALAEVKESAADLVVELAPAVSAVAKLVGLLSGDIPQMDWSHGYVELTAEQREAQKRQEMINAAIVRMGVNLSDVGNTPFAADWAARMRAEGNLVAAAAFGRLVWAQAALEEATRLADEGLLNEDGTIRTVTESVEELGEGIKTASAEGTKGVADLGFATSQMKTQAIEAVDATGAAFAKLPGLITAHRGDVAAAMKEITDSLRAERDFEVALGKLAAAGLTGLVKALEDSPDRAAAMAAAEGFAADLGAAADIEAEIRIQAALAISASNPLLAVYTARYQAAADAWEKYGEAMAAEFLAGYGNPNPDTTPPADVVYGDDDELPRLAEGGTVRRTGVAVIHRGETVVPADARAAIGGSSVDSFSIEVPVILNGREIARAIADDVQKEIERNRRSRS